MASKTTFKSLVIFIFIYKAMGDYKFDPREKIALTKEQIDKPKMDLWVIGTFLAAHKYFDVDLRYVTGFPSDADRVFYKNFPKPALKTLHEEAMMNCEQGVTQCVTNILEKATKSSCLSQIFGKQDKPSAPFDTDFELFSYRTTASYYMCWYTMMEEEYLKFTEGVVDKTQGCLDFLAGVAEVPSYTKAELFTSGQAAIVDTRNMDSTLEQPFVCPRLWFCPDPCYGRTNKGNANLSKKDSGNPCRALKNDTCGWKYGHNLDFQSLVRNKFNITCECDNEKKGFEWNSQFEMCVDKDECFDGTANCPSNRICKNTIGSYICTCPRGYAPNKDTDVCERTLLMHKNSRLLKFDPDINKPKEESLLSQAMDFVGLSSATNTTIDWCMFLLSIFIVIL